MMRYLLKITLSVLLFDIGGAFDSASLDIIEKSLIGRALDLLIVRHKEA